MTTDPEPDSGTGSQIGSEGPAPALGVDAVFVVHVRSGAEDRAASVERQAARLGFKFSYMLDGDVADLTPELLGRWLTGTMARPTAIASCTVKHLLICDRMLQEGRRDALVLEDDILLSDDFVTAFNRSLAELRTRGDGRFELSFISFENSGLEPIADTRPGVTLYRANHGRCCGAYWLTATVARRFLERAEREKTSVPIGHFQNKLFHAGEVDMWWQHPATAEQGSHSGVFDSILTSHRPGGFHRKLKWALMKFYHLKVRPLFRRRR